MKPIDSFIEAEKQGDFALWLNKPIYAVYKTSSGCVKNVKTGENMGKEVTLRMHFHDENFLPLQTERYDDDCFEFAEDTQ